MKNGTILVAEGNEGARRQLTAGLLRRGFDVIQAHGTLDILEAVRDRSPDLAIVGSCPAGGGDALDLVRKIRGQNRTVRVILLTEASSEELAIAALKAGISDYFKAPVSFEEVLASVERCLGLPATPGGRPNQSIVPDLVNGHRMIGESEAMQAIKEYIKKVAPTDSNVLVTGETGTGKDLAAELIHRNSPRRDRPLVCINCAAIPDGLLESELFGHERGAFTGADAPYEGKLKLADGGTAFFDEIGDMSPSAQSKILRAIETKEVDRLGGRRSVPLNVRIVAATNHDPEALVAQGKFRKDLYFRLNVARIHVPPLRERRHDILPLLGHYLRQARGGPGPAVAEFTEDARAGLLAYDWPGNVRELRNLIETLGITLPRGTVSLADLPEQVRRSLAQRPPRGDERDRLLSALLSTDWNKTRAAKALHWSRMTVYRKVTKYHLVPPGDVTARRPETAV